MRDGEKQCRWMEVSQFLKRYGWNHGLLKNISYTDKDILITVGVGSCRKNKNVLLPVITQ